MNIKPLLLLALTPFLFAPLCAKPAPVAKPSRATLARDMTAALNGRNLAAVKLLVERGADVNARGNTGRTPLLVAAYEGDAKFVEALIEKGARVNDASDRSFSSETPLLLAAYKGNVEAARVLIAHGADVNTRSGSRSPLRLAAANNDNAFIKMLLDAGVSADHRDDHGLYETPLMIAARTANVEGVQLLIAHGANVNAHESHGFSVLVIASNAINTPWTLSARDKKALAEKQEKILLLLKEAGAREPQASDFVRVGKDVGF